MTIQIENTGTLAPVIPSDPVISPPLATPTTGPPSGGVAEFEKVQVTTIVTKVSGTTAVDAFGEVVCLDDRIRAVGEFKVIGINHIVNKDGSVSRVQTVAPCGELSLVPWDPGDPRDMGIVRARP